MFDSYDFLKHATEAPGIYQMLDAAGTIIYIGKAKNLKKRLASYFRASVDSVKTAALVKKITDIRLIATMNENEALLLESHLIKQYRPRYNILFKDDKSFPYLHLTDHPYPRLNMIRSTQKPPGQYFGPYPSADSVREALELLQKLFLIRPCSDRFFNHRSRPCLQHAIKRCSAPCVGLISQQQYQADIANASAFLQGNSQALIQTLVERMNHAAAQKHYEQAAVYRDQIQVLHQLDKDQQAHGGHADIFAIVSDASHLAIQAMHVRLGKISGNQRYFPANLQQQDAATVLESFIAQFYLNQPEREIPREMIINITLPEQKWLSSALADIAKHPVKIISNVKEQRLAWLNLAIDNAKLALSSHIASKDMMQQRYVTLAETLKLPVKEAWRLECFDISHSLGEATVASCVVFDEHGPLKSAYRIFNIEGITPGDDVAAMAQVMRRRYSRLKADNLALPDLILIDGGKGQLNSAKTILADLGLTDVLIIGIAKGEGRKPGLETLWIRDDQTALQLPYHSPALHLLQHSRDEAHRFAISKHRAKRRKQRQVSTLESIEGLGIKKRQDLLNFFGGMIELKKASVKELQKVNGIGLKMAQKISAGLKTRI